MKRDQQGRYSNHGESQSPRTCLIVYESIDLTIACPSKGFVAAPKRNGQHGGRRRHRGLGTIHGAAGQQRGAGQAPELKMLDATGDKLQLFISR